MGKRIISQARGHGSHTYRVRKKAFRYRLAYPKMFLGDAEVIKLFNSSAHSAPLAKIKYAKGTFYVPAFKGMIEGQKINAGETIENGNIVKLKDIPLKTPIYNIESKPGDGGKFIKTGGNSARINKIIGEDVFVIFPSKKEK